MKLNHTAVVMGIALALFLGPRSATAWTSGSEETPGFPETRGFWSWAKSAPGVPANEHAELLKKAFEHAGLPLPLFPSPTEPFKAQVFTEGGMPTQGGFPSFIPAPISNAKAIATRRYTLPGFAALPDHSYALWDWASGNETCPADTFEGTDLSGKDPAVACHTFKSHMGILNSTHFPPQSSNTYAWYHKLALARAKECKTLNDNFVAASLNYSDPDQRLRIDAMVKECEREALVIEAVGQHFLQDTWAMGHMWQRWGTPFLSGFNTDLGATTSRSTSSKEEQRARGELVAAVAGLVHGADSFVGKSLVYESRDQMSYGRSPDITWRQLRGVGFSGQGIGDIYADVLLSNPDYVTQRDMLLACSAAGVSEVYRKTAMVSGKVTRKSNIESPTTPGGVRGFTPDPVGPECSSQRATNLAIWEGFALNIFLRDPLLEIGVPVRIGRTNPIFTSLITGWSTALELLGYTAKADLLAELTTNLMKTGAYVELRKQDPPVGAPTGVDLANSGLVPPGDTFMQTGINSVLTENQDDPPAPYADPWRQDSGLNPPHLQDPDTHGRYIARVFHKAHVADWCIDDEADPKQLQKRVVSATPAERPAAYEACVEFTERHVRLGSMPSICEAATASSLPNSFGDTTGATDVKTAAERFCDCAGASAVALSGSALSANAASYTFTDLGTLEGSNSYATAINNAGQVAGWSYTANNAAVHATVWNGATATDLGTLGGRDSRALAINNAGQVVGWSDTVNDVTHHATVWNGATATDLGTLWGTLWGGSIQEVSFQRNLWWTANYRSMALAINYAGQVAGWSQAADAPGFAAHATVWNGATATDLGTLDGAISGSYSLSGHYSNAAAINTAGQVAGWSETANGAAHHATVWNGTTATDLGTLGGRDSRALAINNAGQVVGWSDTANGAQHATVWNGTTATDLGTLGGSSSLAHAINTAGQVVGWSYANGAQHATVWNGTTATDLNIFLDASTVNAGWVLNEATGINDNGWIVGNASNPRLGIQSHAFLLSVGPVEPCPKPKPTP